MSGSLTIVGTGIKSIAQITREAAIAIESSDIVFYGAAEPSTVLWITEHARSSECLDMLYAEGKDRMVTYDEMAERILVSVRQGLKVCVSFEGHPGVFVHVAHCCLRVARTEGFRARMLPGVSTLDCLIADILVDPAQNGCQSFETTDFLLRSYQPDVTSMLVLWQVGCIGEAKYSTVRQSRQNVEILAEVLGRFYGLDHSVAIYQAAIFSISSPTINWTAIRSLADHDLSLATLYVPPLREGPVNQDFLRRFGLLI